MQRRTRWPRRTSSLALLPFLLLVACGVGPVTETSFVYGSMDASGGTLTVPDVTLMIPAGALAGPTTVAVIPETTARTIEPPLGDPCVYVQLAPQWCCGPVGLDLLQDGSLVVAYDASILPAFAVEEDLVLLIWDATQDALVLAGNEAVHDTQANTFEISAYGELGPFAIGLRVCDLNQIIQLVLNPFIPKPGDGSTAQYGSQGLYLVSIDGSTTPEHIDTGTDLPDTFLPSPDGRRILFRSWWEDEFEFLRPVLHTATLDGSPPTYLAGEDTDIIGSGATLGWMRDGLRVFFQEFNSSYESNGISTVPGDGSTVPSELYTLMDSGQVTDLRQSLDGSMVLIAYGDMYGDIDQKVHRQYAGEQIDVFNALTGSVISEDLIPAGGGHNTPRFLPNSSGVYLVDSDGAGVERYDPDGSNQTTLYAMPPAHGRMKDFILAPNGDNFAYIAIQQPSIGVKPTQVAVLGYDALYVGSLSGGVREIIDLGQDAYYEEMFFHPGGRSFFFDTQVGDVRIFNAADGVEGPALGIGSVADLDIASGNGRLLLTVRTQQGTIGDSIDQFDTRPPGLYAADPDGRNQTLVPSAIPDLEIVAGRWLYTVRRAPCMGRTSCFR